jgi:hypothetical protein
VEDKQVWVEQLESLRVFGTAPKSNEERKIFSPKEVTTKARIVSKPEPAYTNEARANQVSGAVILRADFAFDGTVKYLMVVQGLPYGLTEASVKSATHQVCSCHTRRPSSLNSGPARIPFPHLLNITNARTAAFELNS